MRSGWMIGASMISEMTLCRRIMGNMMRGVRMSCSTIIDKRMIGDRMIDFRMIGYRMIVDRVIDCTREASGTSPDDGCQDVKF